MPQDCEYLSRPFGSMFCFVVSLKGRDYLISYTLRVTPRNDVGLHGSTHAHRVRHQGPLSLSQAGFLYFKSFFFFFCNFFFCMVFVLLAILMLMWKRAEKKGSLYYTLYIVPQRHPSFSFSVKQGRGLASLGSSTNCSSYCIMLWGVLRKCVLLLCVIPGSYIGIVNGKCVTHLVSSTNCSFFSFSIKLWSASCESVSFLLIHMYTYSFT